MFEFLANPEKCHSFALLRLKKVYEVVILVPLLPSVYKLFVLQITLRTSKTDKFIDLIQNTVKC